MKLKVKGSFQATKKQHKNAAVIILYELAVCNIGWQFKHCVLDVSAHVYAGSVQDAYGGVWI